PIPLATYTTFSDVPSAHQRRGVLRAGPTDQPSFGLKIKGWESAGVRLWVVAARRMRLSETEIDWTERLRERKEGWWRRMWWSGGFFGGGG
ncbi:hypothetical protein A2U01_0080392, partial [Trifolium medium]|nr:hypothetical protein [Trifolium medium]